MSQEISLEDYKATHDRTFFQRTFGKVERGSLRGAVLALVSTAIGAGCLALPVAFRFLGVILGTIMLLFASFCAYMGLMGVSLAGHKYRIYNYPDLVKHVLGSFWGYFLELTIITYVYGTLIGYQIMIGIFVPNICSSVGIKVDSQEERMIAMVGANVLVMAPLALFRQLSSLRVVSLLSALALVYITVIVVAEFPYFVNQNDFSEVDLFKVDSNIFSGFAFCLYSFACHTNVSQVQGELRANNLRRVSKVAMRAVGLIVVPYIALGSFGYLSTLEETPTLILMRQPPTSISNDWLMVVARVLMTLTLVFAVPINIPPCRASIIKTLFRVEGTPPFSM